MDEFRTSFTAELWQWDGNAAWHFFSLPEEDADHIRELFGGRARGFGSVRVDVRVGATRWQTSVFPDRGRNTYLLPVKKAVRRAEGLEPGSPVEVDLVVRL